MGGKRGQGVVAAVVNKVLDVMGMTRTVSTPLIALLAISTCLLFALRIFFTIRTLTVFTIRTFALFTIRTLNLSLFALSLHYLHFCSVPYSHTQNLSAVRTLTLFTIRTFALFPIRASNPFTIRTLTFFTICTFALSTIRTFISVHRYTC